MAPGRSKGLARVYLGVLLAAMAAGQAISWDVFVDAVSSYRTGPAGVIAALLLGAEALAAVGLLVNPPNARTRSAAAWLGLAVAVGWSALAVQAFARGLVVPNCGCFGAHLAQSLNWTVLVQDAAFVGLAAWHLRGAREPGGR